MPHLVRHQWEHPDNICDERALHLLSLGLNLSEKAHVSSLRVVAEWHATWHWESNFAKWVSRLLQGRQGHCALRSEWHAHAGMTQQSCLRVLRVAKLMTRPQAACRRCQLVSPVSCGQCLQRLLQERCWLAEQRRRLMCVTAVASYRTRKLGLSSVFTSDVLEHT